MVRRLVRNFNDYLLYLFLIRMDLPESPRQTLKFNVDVRPEYPIKEPIDDLAPERTFREFEFWLVFVSSLDPEFYKNWTQGRDANFLNFDCGHYTDVEDLQVREGFNNFGAFIWVVQRDNSNDRLIKFYYRNHMKSQKLFAGYEMTLETLPGQLPRISVIISDRPLGWLLCATAAEKLNFARELHDKYLKMVEFILREV
jgi:hypothetical protein